MSGDATRSNASPVTPQKRFIHDIQEAQERGKPDLTLSSIFTLDARLISYRRETGCNRFVVYHECPGHILIWRDED
jgi:hypothetical protein